MNSLLRKTIDIRDGEWNRALIMAAYIFVIMASYNILKPMARSLFVTNLGPLQLPALYILLAAIVGLVSILYLRISSNLRLDRLITFTALFFAGNLVVFWWLLEAKENSTPLYYSLFIWTSIYGILTSTQYWLLANHLFNAREAKRLFPFLTATAILGGIVGGYLTRVSVGLLGGTANLTFLGIGLLGLTAVLVNCAWRFREEPMERTPRSRPRDDTSQSSQKIGEVFKLIKNSRHLSFLVSIVGLTYMVVQIADFQFIAFASEHIEGTDALTGFLGLWLSNLSLVALLFQVFFAGFIIRKFGVGATILFLPIALMLSSVWVLFSATLISILAIKISDGAFRHSINKVGTELLYLPISTEIKKKTKAFVDMFVDRFARGLAGVLLLVFYSWLGFSVSQISILSIVLIVIWLGFSVRTYREYVDSFRQALANRRIDVDSLNYSIKDLSVINSLIISMASTNQRQVIYALRMLESVEGVELMSPLRPLLNARYTTEVRLRALKLLQEHGDESLLPEIESLLHDEDAAIRSEALRFCVKFSKTASDALLKGWLNDEDFGLRGAALQYLAEHKKSAENLLSRAVIKSFLKQGPAGRVLVAEAVGMLEDEHYYPYLKDLLSDTEPRVKRRAILSAGKTRCHEFVPLLVGNLTDRRSRQAAREALALYGDTIAADLQKSLKDQALAAEARVSLVRVLEKIGTQKSVEILLDNLVDGEKSLRHVTIKALNKLRTRFADLSFDKRVDKALLEELQEYFQLQATLHQTNGYSANGSGEKRPDLLRQALHERLDDHLQRIFHLLGLQYPPRDIDNAYAAANSSNRSIRANAIEFLDNILSGNYKEQLLLVVDDLPIEQILERADGLLKVRFSNPNDALHYLLNTKDPWLQACSLYEIGQRGLVEHFKEQIEEALREPDPLVKETANLVLQKKFS